MPVFLLYRNGAAPRFHPLWRALTKADTALTGQTHFVVFVFCYLVSLPTFKGIFLWKNFVPASSWPPYLLD